MIKLSGRAVSASLPNSLTRSVWSVTDASRAQEHAAYLVSSDAPPPPGYGLYLTKPGLRIDDASLSQIELPVELAHLAPGDILSVHPEGRLLRVLWRHASKLNSILLTERCDNFCLMCSQPPKRANDDWLLHVATELVKLLPHDTGGLIFTGGEPTVYGTKLIELLELCSERVPDAGIHVLSNGRRFADAAFASEWASIQNPNLMVGIPLYGSEPSLHDYVVQARGAFDQTVRGILNLARRQQRVEIRVVIHRQTAPALVDIANFIVRNLPFVDQVALMGLEIMGFTRANLDELWIDPYDYRGQLSEAALTLQRSGIRTMIYNHQLCLIEERVWPLAVQSISDWKNEYLPVCETCTVRPECGGFFHSAKYRHSDRLAPVVHHETATVR